MMKLNTRLIISGLVLFTLYSSGANALALADIELKSSLNQQLDVRIRLLTSATDEMNSLEVKVTGITRESNSYQTIPHLQHEIIQDESGNYIKVSSRDAVREPVLSFLVEVSWAGGHFLREYSLLIDPVLVQ